MARRVRQNWKVGDIFLIPLSDGSFSVGQILMHEADALNSVICSFHTIRISSEQGVSDCLSAVEEENNLISVQFTTVDLLESGVWKIVTNIRPRPINKYINIKKMKLNGFVGVKVIGSGIIIKFIEACFGLYPWDGFHDSTYLDKLLLDSSKKPKNITYKEK